MKSAKIVVGAFIAYIALIIAFESMIGFFQPASETTLVIATTDSDGVTNDRVLAALESSDQLFVAANHWPRAWYRQALENPNVEITYKDQSGTYVAAPASPAEAERLNREHDTGIAFRILTGFPPRYFLRLDPS